ncbi:Hypothetical Protein FCC1311_074072 [Hondaea fermentalgiana]|uniref:Uncharacterized protein n=1 Tax=Hondaea fermentalgiana TaxID=2315210 RepID=A0A2R5GJV8_9STRA|nr:Hypothetical Protein FCC1311_074072 [Hondaea fermentalgiana]|eukprot:GBG31186.1 Hypothetical Protein FCC1311_074072 [Hondaea fermentalgiana]
MSRSFTSGATPVKCGQNFSSAAIPVCSKGVERVNNDNVECAKFLFKIQIKPDNAVDDEVSHVALLDVECTMQFMMEKGITTATFVCPGTITKSFEELESIVRARIQAICGVSPWITARLVANKKSHKNILMKFSTRPTVDDLDAVFQSFKPSLLINIVKSAIRGVNVQPFARLIDTEKLTAAKSAVMSASIPDGQPSSSAAKNVSTNDILTSAFRRATASRILLMATNWRGRLGSLTPQDAGNFESASLQTAGAPLGDPVIPFKAVS